MAIWSQIKDIILKMLGSLSIYFIGRHTGAKDERHRHYRSDVEKARKIEDAADRVRRADGGNLSPVERLRKYKRLRDISDDV